MADKVYLAVDVGAESGRVMAGLWNGKRIRLEEIHRFPNGPVALGNSIRWDVMRLWAEIQNGLALAGKEFGKTVVSVDADTWVVDFALLTTTDEIMGMPYISYSTCAHLGQSICALFIATAEADDCLRCHRGRVRERPSFQHTLPLADGNVAQRTARKTGRLFLNSGRSHALLKRTLSIIITIKLQNPVRETARTCFASGEFSPIVARVQANNQTCLPPKRGGGARGSHRVDQPDR